VLFFGFGFRGCGLFGEHEEIVEDFLRELVVIEERSGVVGDDELVSLLAVTHRVGVLLVVLNQADDLKLQRLTVVGFDDQNVAQLQRSAFAFAFIAGTVPGAVRTFDDDSPYVTLVQVTFDVRVVLFEGLCERVVSVPFVDVKQILRVDWCEGRVDRGLAGVGDGRRR
jgi:hypothetical protein